MHWVFHAVEEIQRAVVRLVATHPAGFGLCLIGGFRYRFLDQSARNSRDIDYHWEGDLTAKQSELVSLFQRRLLPEIRRRLGSEGDVRAATGPESDSPSEKIVELAFWSPGSPGRIEIPVDLTRIVRRDPPTVRTHDGVVYPTPSDADLVEAKVIALFSRSSIESRDLVDIFLFSSHLRPDSAQRLREKLVTIMIGREMISPRLRDLEIHAGYHIRGVAAVITDQMDPGAAANIEAAGGAAMLFETVRRLLLDELRLGEEEAR